MMLHRQRRTAANTMYNTWPGVVGFQKGVLLIPTGFVGQGRAQKSATCYTFDVMLHA